MKKALLILLALSALLAGLFAQRWFATGNGIGAKLEAVFPDLEGKPHDLAEWKGRVVIVNFWATWCPPCVEEMPEFVKLQRELGPKGVQFVGILTDDEADAAREFLQAMPLNYPVLNGEAGGRLWAEKLGDKAGVLPYSAVFDPTGKLIHAEAGRFTRDEVLRIVMPLANQGH